MLTLLNDLKTVEHLKPNITVCKSWTPCTNPRGSPSNATESNGLA
jgi:hypothetical protein